MVNKILTYEINNSKVDVHVKNTNNKNMYLKLIDEKIFILIPKNTSFDLVDRFILQNIEKFSKHLNNAIKNIKYSYEKKFIYIFGKKYYFEIITGFQKANYEFDGNMIFLYLNKNSKLIVFEALKKILKKILFEKIEQKQRFWEKEMKVPNHKISIIFKTSSWATNIIQKKKISYSGYLTHYDETVLDYIIVHELCHFIEPNHSKKFWDLVKVYMPSYKEIQKKIK